MIQTRKKLIQGYNLIISKLPKAVKTKIIKSRLDRGGGGIYTKRRNRNGVVNIPYSIFINVYDGDINKLSIYEDGFLIFFSPSDYSNYSDKESLKDNKIVLYQNNEDITKYPYDKKDITKGTWKKFDGYIVVDIKSCDKHREKIPYMGISGIAQHDYDYATKEEVENVQLCLTYQICKIKDFDKYYVNNKKIIKLKEDFIKDLENTDLYKKNDRLIKYCRYGTYCPKSLEFLKFEDIVDGKVEGDKGRGVWNRTTTKINLHHVDRLMPGELNHNHKNVFLGTSFANAFDIALITAGFTSLDEFIVVYQNNKKIIEELDLVE